MIGKLAWRLTKNLPRLAVFGAGAGLAWSAVAVDHSMALGPALPGDQDDVTDASGRSVALYSDTSGSGNPVLLVHSVNAAASSYEMRPLYTRLQTERPVWSLDLPGFGRSDRSDRHYTAELMTSATTAALARIGEPADVVALSLGAEFAARAAIESPGSVRSLSLISPTGFGPRRNRSETVGAALRFPLWSQAVYDGIASRRSIRYFLGKSFTGAVDEMLVDYCYRTAHQPGARHAPLTFLAGDLFSDDAVADLYSKVEVRAQVLYDRDPFSSFITLPQFLADRPEWGATRIARTCGLPHWDEPTETLNALGAFWKQPSEA